MDAQLPPKLATQLTATGYLSYHSSERLRPRSSDPTIAALANALGAFVMSKDEDFVDILQRGQLRTGLVWVRSGNLRFRDQLNLVQAALPEITGRMAAGQNLIEIA